MRFPQSASIRREIRSARRILLNIHRNPDLDSIGSALAMQAACRNLGKPADIVGPHEPNPDYLFLKGAGDIMIRDFRTFDASPYDLMVVLDSGSPQIVTASRDIPLPGIPRIVIDHHRNNSIEAKIKLVDEHASSTAEILFHLFEDWKMEINPGLATFLFAGASHDTMFFRYNENEADTFAVAARLIAQGADKNSILSHVYNNMTLPYIVFVGKMLERIKYEEIPGEKEGFVWSAVDAEEYDKMGRFPNIREYVADSFIQSVKGAAFGIIMVEETKGRLSLSFRGKEGTDMSALAQRFGGGGHLLRAGATVYGKDFREMVETVLDSLKQK